MNKKTGCNFYIKPGNGLSPDDYLKYFWSAITELEADFRYHFGSSFKVLLQYFHHGYAHPTPESIELCETELRKHGYDADAVRKSINDHTSGDSWIELNKAEKARERAGRRLHQMLR